MLKLYASCLRHVRMWPLLVLIACASPDLASEEFPRLSENEVASTFCTAEKFSGEVISTLNGFRILRTRFVDVDANGKSVQGFLVHRIGNGCGIAFINTPTSYAPASANAQPILGFGMSPTGIPMYPTLLQEFYEEQKRICIASTGDHHQCDSNVFSKLNSSSVELAIRNLNSSTNNYEGSFITLVNDRFFIDGDELVNTTN